MELIFAIANEWYQYRMTSKRKTAGTFTAACY
jgi:hypothetical protein